MSLRWRRRDPCPNHSKPLQITHGHHRDPSGNFRYGSWKGTDADPTQRDVCAGDRAPLFLDWMAPPSDKTRRGSRCISLAKPGVFKGGSCSESAVHSGTSRGWCASDEVEGREGRSLTGRSAGPLRTPVTEWMACQTPPARRSSNKHYFCTARTRGAAPIPHNADTNLTEPSGPQTAEVKEVVVSTAHFGNPKGQPASQVLALYSRLSSHMPWALAPEWSASSETRSMALPIFGATIACSRRRRRTGLGPKVISVTPSFDPAQYVGSRLGTLATRSNGSGSGGARTTEWVGRFAEGMRCSDLSVTLGVGDPDQRIDQKLTLQAKLPRKSVG